MIYNIGKGKNNTQRSGDGKNVVNKTLRGNLAISKLKMNSNFTSRNSIQNFKQRCMDMDSHSITVISNKRLEATYMSSGKGLYLECVSGKS